MTTIAEIEKIASQLSIRLDTPQSVKLQVKQVSLAQKQLRTIKKEINSTIRNINQQAAQSMPDSLISVGLDLFGKRKLAGSIRANTRREIEREKKETRQPYLDLKNWIDSLILEGDRIKLVAEEFLLNHSRFEN